MSSGASSPSSPANANAAAAAGSTPLSPPAARRRWWRVRRGRLRQEWPLLIWLLVGGVVIWSISRGRVFERMNGQVEENYQYIAPSQGGRLLRILVKPGDRVEPGGIVAELDPAPWHKQIQGLLLGMTADRRENLEGRLRERAAVQRELGILRETAAADGGRLAALVPAPAAAAPGTGRNSGSASSSAPAPNAPSPRPLLLKQQEAADLRQADAGEVSARLTATRGMIPVLEARLAALDTETAGLRAAADQLAGTTPGDEPEKLLAMLPEPERAQLQEMLDGVAHCRIPSAIGGVVDKVVKNPGDYLLAGDHLLEMVGSPKHITAFVGDGEAADLQPGDRVWVTPAHGRKWAIHESTVLRAAPDAERLPVSSKAGSGAYRAGRRITVAFPPSAHASGPDTVTALLPGEGITVHLEHPGGFSLLRRLGSMAAE